jgi:hypothetical protein
MRNPEAFTDAINNDSASRKFDLEHWLRRIRAGVSVPDLLEEAGPTSPLYCHTISYDVWNRWRLLSLDNPS